MELTLRIPATDVDDVEILFALKSAGMIEDGAITFSTSRVTHSDLSQTLEDFEYVCSVEGDQAKYLLECLQDFIGDRHFESLHDWREAHRKQLPLRLGRNGSDEDQLDEGLGA